MRSLTHFCLTKLPQDEMLDCFRPPDQGCEVSQVSEVLTGLPEISQCLEKGIVIVARKAVHDSTLLREKGMIQISLCCLRKP